MNNPVWDWLIRTRLSGYVANEKMGGPDSCEVGPVWSFERFGQSSTMLPDRTQVWIGGEHEDSYDPDFYIYNDVVVKHPDGRMDIFGYPREQFPPTDFHSATLVGREIVVIGSLGYMEDRRPGSTQVLIVDLDTMKVTRRTCSGTPPGWIHGHTAVLEDEGRSILVRNGKLQTTDKRSLIENIDDWRLDLSTWQWERRTARTWSRWIFRRKNGTPNQLWQMEQTLWLSKWERKEGFAEFSGAIKTDLGREPDLELLGCLYKPSVPHQAVPPREEEFQVHRVVVSGVTIRYVQDMYSVQMTIEGNLDKETAETLANDLQAKLTRLENCEYERIPLH